MAFETKTVLVSGGAGFIGSHLVEYFVQKGNKVICLDNLYSGSRDNVFHLFDNPLFIFEKHDITELFSHDVDYIYNLASPASPKNYQLDPVFTIRTNIIGSFNMLELARKTDARILQASTSEVYGDPLEHPQKETYWGNVNPIGARSCYDESKRAAETLFFDYHRQFGTDIRVVRIFNTYGPRMAIDDGRVVSNFIVQALRGEDVAVYGDGMQTRSFQYIGDLIEGMITMMENKKGFIGPVNLGNTIEFTIKEVAEKIIEMTGSKSKIVYKSLPDDDPKQRKPDISLAKKELGWDPKVSFEEGIKKTIVYFKEKLRL